MTVRHCNGGPNGSGWCGAHATVVCTASDGLQWYACDDEAHREGAATMPLSEWFDLVDRRIVVEPEETSGGA
jgi:hypothetical protein